MVTDIMRGKLMVRVCDNGDGKSDCVGIIYGDNNGNVDNGAENCYEGGGTEGTVGIIIVLVVLIEWRVILTVKW